MAANDNFINSIGIPFTDLPVFFGGTGVVNVPLNALIVGQGTEAFSSIVPGNDGQVLLGASGTSIPAFASLTSTGGTIAFTTGTNSLNLETSGTEVYTVRLLTDSDSPYTILTTDQYLSCDVSGGVLTLDLPDAPATGRVFSIKDSGGDAVSNNITITTTGGSVTIDGATTFVMNSAFESVDVIFNGTSYEVF